MNRLLAEVRMAGFVDDGQKAGQIATQGKPDNPRNPGIKTLADLGVDDRRLAEARRLRRNYSEEEIRELGRTPHASSPPRLRA